MPPILPNPWATTCPRCGRESALLLVCGPEPSARLSNDFKSWAAMYTCPTCRGYCLSINATPFEDGSGGLTLIERLPFGTAKPVLGLPAEVDADRNEAWSPFLGGLHKGAALLARSSLESAAKNLGASGKDLQTKIDHLADSGRITNDLATWAHEVRVTGNEAAHEMGQVSEADAKDGLFFLDAFLDAVYSVPERHRQRRAQRESAGTDGS